MTENNVIEFSDQDKADLEALGIPEGEVPTFHPVLEVWREVLKPAAAEGTKKVTPQWASRMVSTYARLDYADMEDVRDRYFGKLAELSHILDLEIASDENCLSYSTPEEDAEHNSLHYKQLLIDWQRQFLQWELDWACTEESAVAELAAISEAHKMFFSETGITAYLDNIKFQFTEADSNDLAEALNDLRGEDQ